MPRTPARTFTALAALLSVAISVPAAAANDYRISTVASENATIFLAEILRVQPGEGCAYFHRRSNGRCNTRVTARILRVLKGTTEQQNVPTEFETEIHQVFQVSNPGPWSVYNIEAGQRYLICSRAKENLPAIFASSLGPVPITDDEDTVGDVELIVGSEPLSLPQQASAVASAIRDSTKPHGHFLSDYAARLLAAGSDFETAELRQAVENSPDRAFSDSARSELLHRLWNESRSAPQRPENFWHVYVVMTARYFLIEPDRRDPAVPDLRSAILSRHIPWLLGSSPAKALIGAAVPAAVGQQFRKKALEELAGGRLRADELAQLRQFAELIKIQ